MVFDRPQQIAAARASVRSFFSQNWPYRELVIFNSTEHRLLPWWRKERCLEIRLKHQQPHEMLKLCAENANGEWFVNWLPDCWYDDQYLRCILKHREKGRLVVLKHKRVYSLAAKKLAVVTNSDIPCWSFYRHFPVNFELPLAPQFGDVMEVNNSAHLIVKFAREIV